MEFANAANTTGANNAANNAPNHATNNFASNGAVSLKYLSGILLAGLKFVYHKAM